MVSLGKGWIKLYRQSEENPLYFSEPFDRWHAWQDLLLIVNHERKQFISKGQLITLEPGQTVTSDRILAQRWHWSREKVRRFLKLLNDTSMCTIKRTTNGTILTVINWAKFQGTQTTDETTDETTGKTTDETTDETLTRMNKNDKKGKKCVSAPSQSLTPSLDEVKAYCRERGFTHVNAEKFWNLYESRNWLDNGQPFKWKQRLAYWEAKDMAKEETSPKKEHISKDDIRDMAERIMKRREEANDSNRSNGTGN